MKIFKKLILFIPIGIVLTNLILAIPIFSIRYPTSNFLTIPLYPFIISSLIGAIIGTSPFLIRKINRSVRNTVARHTYITLIGAFDGGILLVFWLLFSGISSPITWKTCSASVGMGSIIGGSMFLMVNTVNQLTKRKSRRIRSISLASGVILGTILFGILFFPYLCNLLLAIVLWIYFIVGVKVSGIGTISFYPRFYSFWYILSFFAGAFLMYRLIDMLSGKIRKA